MLSFKTRSRSFNGFPIETFFGEEYRKTGKQGYSRKKVPQKIGKQWNQNNGTRYFCLSFFLLKVKKRRIIRFPLAFSVLLTAEKQYPFNAI
jgi:hypothetical protein